MMRIFVKLAVILRLSVFTAAAAVPGREAGKVLDLADATDAVVPTSENPHGYNCRDAYEGLPRSITKNFPPNFSYPSLGLPESFRKNHPSLVSDSEYDDSEYNDNKVDDDKVNDNKVDDDESLYAPSASFPNLSTPTFQLPPGTRLPKNYRFPKSFKFPKGIVPAGYKTPVAKCIVA